MPTLTRRLLVFACLLVAPLSVMADELPEDTNKIESLTVEQAKRVVAEFKGNYLQLNGLTTLDADTAKALAEFKGKELWLNGLTTLDADTAKPLADFKGDSLDLNGLTTLDADTAKALAEFKGKELWLNGLTTLDADTAKALAESDAWDGQLPRLTTLDTDTAKALAQFKGEKLWLNGLTTLDADTAKALAEFKGDNLYLSGLTTLDAATAKAIAEFKGENLYLSSLTTLDAATANAFAEYAGSVSFNDQTAEQFIAAHPFGKDTALAHAIVREGGLYSITTLDTETAKALAEFKGPRLRLERLQRASFGAVRALRNHRHVSMPNHWYLLRYQIAALVGTVVFLIMAGIVVWYSRRQRHAG